MALVKGLLHWRRIDIDCGRNGKAGKRKRSLIGAEAITSAKSTVVDWCPSFFVDCTFGPEQDRMQKDRKSF